MKGNILKRHFTDVGARFLRELRYGTRLWVRDREATAKDRDEQVLRLRGKGPQRDEWLTSDDEILTSAELAEAFYVELPDVRNQ